MSLRRCPALVLGALLIGVPAAAENTKVLVVGDSQLAGPFGWRLNRLLQRDDSLDVVLEGRVGSSPRSWIAGRMGQHPVFARGPRNERQPRRLRGRSIGGLLNRFDPDVVVVELGGNMMNAPRLQAKAITERFIARLNRGRPRRCFWIGPPTVRSNARRDECGEVESLSGDRLTVRDISDVLPEWVRSQCTYFESRPVTAYPKTCARTDGDGLHFYQWRLAVEGEQSQPFFREILNQRPYFVERRRGSLGMRSVLTPPTIRVSNREYPAQAVRADEVAAYWAEQAAARFFQWLRADGL